MSQAIATSRELRNKDTRLDLSVPDYHEVSGLLSNDEVFHIIVITSLPYFKTITHQNVETVQFMLEKRYNEFETLHKSLSDRFPATVLPVLPRKVLMMKDSTPQERRASFDNFMRFVACNPKVAASSLLLEFLGVRPEKIAQVEQTALAQAEAAKAGIINKDGVTKGEGDDDVDSAPSPKKSQTPKKHSVGLFDDFGGEDDDLDLFKVNKEEDLMKGIIDEEDGNLFGSSSSSVTTNGHSNKATIPSIFSNDAQHARQPAPALFEAAGQITDDDMYIPPGGATEIMTPTNVEGAVEEDYSDLLNIDEDIDQLMLVTSPTKKPSQIPSTKPSVTAPKPGTKPPLTAPKPGTKPPITAPKPGARPSVTTPKPGTKQTFNAQKSGTTTAPPNATQKPQSSPSKPTPKPRTIPKPDQSSQSEAVTDATDNSGDAMLELGDGDILKYIQENENTEESTLDLF